jgi:multiple sugar transport system ATP-binding protein
MNMLAFKVGLKTLVSRAGFFLKRNAPKICTTLGVAGFIGTPIMNFFEDSKLLLEDGVYYAQIHHAKFRLDDFQQKALAQNGQQPCDVVCGIRPCHVTVGEGELTAKVEAAFSPIHGRDAIILTQQKIKGAFAPKEEIVTFN